MLNALEDAGVDLRLMSLGRAINHPNIIAGAAQVIAHLLKTGTIEKTGNSDEAHDPRFASWPVVVNFPRRPAPEVNIEITEMLGVRTDAPFTWRHPSGEGCGFLRLLVFTLDPSTPA